MTFSPVAGGRSVSLKHTGLERVGVRDTCPAYEPGWTEILGWYGWYAKRARAGAGA
jgi:hypothetical protein